MSTSALAIRDAHDTGLSTDLRLPAPVDKKALASYLTTLEDPEALELQNRLAKAYDTACRSLIGENDVQKEGGREFKKKSAWKKLARYFSISTTVIERDERFLNDASTGESVFVAMCTVRATAPWGQIADAIGACATDEETGRRKITIADAIATAETRASNRATSNLIAMGEVSAEETTRGEREQVHADALREMTLDEAKAVKFPWKNPEKYRDKPLGELSLKMLKSVLDATQKEVEKVGQTPRRMELLRACELLIASKDGPNGGGEAPPTNGNAGEGEQSSEAERSGSGGGDEGESGKGTPSSEQPAELATKAQRERIAYLLSDPHLGVEDDERTRIAGITGKRTLTTAQASEWIVKLERMLPGADEDEG